VWVKGYDLNDGVKQFKPFNLHLKLLYSNHEIFLHI
jgi:hypothetical protein